MTIPPEFQCPVCIDHPGQEVDGCGCSCIGEAGNSHERFKELREACDRLCCDYCGGEGCGGSCSWCGGTGDIRAWRWGCPPFDGYNLSPEAKAYVALRIEQKADAPHWPGVSIRNPSTT